MSSEPVLVSCANCKKFTPDYIGNGSGLGQCAVYEAQLAKHQNPSIDRAVFNSLGNCNFWGGSKGYKPDRRCSHYVSKYPFTMGD
jgi:hypothetical protein